MNSLNPVPLYSDLINPNDKKATLDYIRFFNSIFTNFSTDQSVISLQGTVEDISGKCFISQSGNIVTIDLSDLKGTSNTNFLKITGINSKYAPANIKQCSLTYVINNGAYYGGYALINTDMTIDINFINTLPTNIFSTTGLKGFGKSSISYTLS